MKLASAADGLPSVHKAMSHCETFGFRKPSTSAYLKKYVPNRERLQMSSEQQRASGPEMADKQPFELPSLKNLPTSRIATNHKENELEGEVN
jgi:hypothetical protein